MTPQAITDEKQRLYHRAITEREYLPIRGRWADTVRKDRERKRRERKKRIFMNSVVV